MRRVNNPVPTLRPPHKGLAAVTGLEPAWSGSTIQRLDTSASQPKLKVVELPGSAPGTGRCERPVILISPQPRNWRPRRESNPDLDLRRVPRCVTPRGLCPEERRHGPELHRRLAALQAAAWLLGYRAETGGRERNRTPKRQSRLLRFERSPSSIRTPTIKLAKGAGAEARKPLARPAGGESPRVTARRPRPI